MMYGRRCSAVSGMVIIVLLWLVTVLFWPHTRRYLVLTDICTAVIESDPPWDPSNDRWWHNLCRLENAVRQIDYDCRDGRWMGSRQVCFDNNLVPKHNCTVYSFGIAYSFQFDDAMAEYGCTVFSFDPSMDVVDSQRSDRVYFKRLGLAATDTDSYVPRLDDYVKMPSKWKMRRLSSIMKELGHAPGSLTIVKMDIESYEWDVMNSLLSDGTSLASIPQLLIEWHLFPVAPPRSRYDELMAILFHFRAWGFHSFHWHSEGEDRAMAAMRTQTETSWVNERFLRAKSMSMSMSKA